MSLADLDVIPALRRSVMEGMEVTEATLSGVVVPSRRYVPAVLELWEMADAVSAEAAAPLEALLRHLVRRQHTTRDEISAAFAQARQALDRSV